MNFVREEYPEYLRNAGEPIVYYAKEIDAAQQEGRKLNPDWGKEKFVNKVEEIISSVHKGDRAGRISYNLRNALKNCEEMVNDAKEDPGLREIETAIKQNEAQNTKLEGKLARVRTGAWEEIEETARRCKSYRNRLRILSEIKCPVSAFVRCSRHLRKSSKKNWKRNCGQNSRNSVWGRNGWKPLPLNTATKSLIY